MSPRPKKQVQQGTGNVSNESKGPNQDPIQQLVEIVVKAYEEGISEGKKSQTSNVMAKAKFGSRKEDVVTQSMKLKEVQIGRARNGNTNNYKRKRENHKDEPEGSQLKKVKADACINCGKNHRGVCLKGKGVCYRCKQKGHMAPQCPKRRIGECFKCGAYDHQLKKCPNKKKKVVGESSDPASRFGDK